MTADAQPAPANSLPARTVLADRYAIKAYVRSTSFTEVYSALDRQTDRAVFVHALRAELASPASGQVLASAVQAAGKLGHAGIAAPIDAASAPPTDFIVTLPVPGHTASELLARRAETGTVGFGARNASRIVLAAIDALAAAHADGVYHGAISTETVPAAGSFSFTVPVSFMVSPGRFGPPSLMATFSSTASGPAQSVT